MESLRRGGADGWTQLMCACKYGGVEDIAEAAKTTMDPTIKNKVNIYIFTNNVGRRDILLSTIPRRRSS